MHRITRVCLASALLGALGAPVVAESRAASATATASALPLATPESQGMSRPRLERMHAELRRFVDEGLHLLTLAFAQHFRFDQHGLFWRFATLVYAAIED